MLAPKKITGLVFAPGARLIWIALAGLFLGSALCPFNPPAGDEPESVKQGEMMNSAAENLTEIQNKRFSGPAPGTEQLETATFALG